MNIPPPVALQKHSWGGLTPEIAAEFELILSGAGENAADAAYVDPPAHLLSEKGGGASCPNAPAVCQIDQPEVRSNPGSVPSIESSNAAPTFKPERAAKPWHSKEQSVDEIKSLAERLQKFCIGGAKTRRVREELHRCGVVELSYRFKRRKKWRKSK